MVFTVCVERGKFSRKKADGVSTPQLDLQYAKNGKCVVHFYVVPRLRSGLKEKKTDMGNKMCKKKVDTVDGTKSPSRFDKIFSRLHLKPKSWKSDSHLNTKQVNRQDLSAKDAKNGSVTKKSGMLKSKSSDWTEADLEVPEKDEAIHLKNPQLSFIFNDNSTPTPPPRKHKKSIREKIESVAKTGIQALQAKKPTEDSNKTEQQPVVEEVCVKKTVRYECPGCNNRECIYHKKLDKKDVPKNGQKRVEKDAKRKKNLSVVSLPNYNDLKLSIANGDCNLKYIDSSMSSSANSLPGESKKLTTAPTGKLENYMTRCRSFGSLLNNKLRTSKEPAGNESDDSFGGLEDWDLGILEHYNPKDASLPRPRKPVRTQGDIMSDVEKLIVTEEEPEVAAPPTRPVRRSESLIKKENQETKESAPKKPEVDQNEMRKVKLVNATPPPTSQSRVQDEDVPLIPVNNLPTQDDDDGKIEHSSLMRILQEFSIKDAQKRNSEGISEETDTNERSIVADTNRNLHNFRKQVSLNDKSPTNVTANFINVEKYSAS